MSNIPQARALLAQALSGDTMPPCDRRLVEEALSLMTRQRRKKVRAKATLAAPTEREVKEIKRIVRQHPFVSILDLARRFRTNPGRISEALGAEE